MKSTLAGSASHPARYGYIDTIRAIAITGVIAVHVASLFRRLPWHASAPAGLGAHGVQMFFVVSSLTLMLSWRARRTSDSAPMFAFYVRRLFRIAPMFWLALLVYAAIYPLWTQSWQDWDGVFNAKAIILTAFFIHGWSPDTINAVVPGGWTIGVEMNFYVVFPFLASTLTNIWRALLFFILMVVVSVLLNDMYAWMNLGYSASASQSFINFWLPNQLPSFALGFAAYYAIVIVPRLRGLPSMLLAAAVGLALFTAFSGLPSIATIHQPFTRGTLVAIATFLLILALAQNPYRVLVNPLMRHIGKVSFSAYLVHFLVLELVRLLIGTPMTTGMLAIGYFAATFVSVVGMTVALSTVTYRWIEAPMIAMGNQLLDRRRPALLNTLSRGPSG